MLAPSAAKRGGSAGPRVDGAYLGVVLSIASVQSNGLQIQAAVQVDSSHNVPLMTMHVSTECNNDEELAIKVIHTEG